MKIKFDIEKNSKVKNKKQTTQNNVNFKNDIIDIKPIIFALFLFTLVIVGTYFLYTTVENHMQNKNKQQKVEKQQINRTQIEQNFNKQYNQGFRTHLRLDNNIYSNDFYNIEYAINRKYKDTEFTKNLEPFFNNLTKIEIPNNDRIYEFEIKGMLSEYGNFTYILYKRTNILEYDNKVIKELNRLKSIKFRNQIKDVHFFLTLTNQYNLIR
ncbi:hypothetical protein [Arcobacter porcinus]|uniref:Uncharacterized protein n=1 Tax=Arcobacter porcinus TaxID=1935204 RepID=A0ABX2YDL1_9BACT|nr:hypothetical protein [Arcobacter porcinus]OCL82863.1 hypothetical protein AAW29_01253 [Arcobacter porcinus]OCL85032.1 hypothetical protein AAW30_00174 [Arcobacter porcinus]OCL86582.1 hypothetical protein AAX30_01305 [Arcobacter porcinus]OCL93082.1 hypothetical protein AAX28_00624 [Arcobacter porcinus]